MKTKKQKTFKKVIIQPPSTYISNSYPKPQKNIVKKLIKQVKQNRSKLPKGWKHL